MIWRCLPFFCKGSSNILCNPTVHIPAPDECIPGECCMLLDAPTRRALFCPKMKQYLVAQKVTQICILQSSWNCILHRQRGFRSFTRSWWRKKNKMLHTNNSRLAYRLPTDYWLHADCLLTDCEPTADGRITDCWLIADRLLSDCSHSPNTVLSRCSHIADGLPTNFQNS